MKVPMQAGLIIRPNPPPLAVAMKVVGGSQRFCALHACHVHGAFAACLGQGDVGGGGMRGEGDFGGAGAGAEVSRHEARRW
eukprot:4744911-Pleurochrysis_carterae.AAC.1